MISNKYIESELRDNFIERKKLGKYLCKSYERLGYENRCKSIGDCGTFLDFGDDNKLKTAYFCKSRLCPMCAWRKSLKMFAQVSQMVEHIENDYHFIHLTLTVPNVSADQLSSKINQMNKAFANLIRHNRISVVIKGYYRALEITYNKKRDDYHPHFHVLIAVPKNYFIDDMYLDQSEWLDSWRQVMNDYSICEVQVRKVYAKKGQSIGKAIAEVTKYSVKPTDYIFSDPVKTDKLVTVFENVLYRRRLVAFGGIFKDIREELHLDDPENGDLIHINEDDKPVSECETIYKYRWSWKSCRYELYAVVKLDTTYINTEHGLMNQETGVLLN